MPKRKKLTGKDASNAPRSVSEMRVDGELVPQEMFLNFQILGDIIPVTTTAGFERLIDRGIHYDQFFKRLREVGYGKEIQYLKGVPELGSQQGVTVILSLSAEVALKVSEEYPFLYEDAFCWLQSKFEQQGIIGNFSARWEVYRAWFAQGNHVYFRWPSGEITVYWLGRNPERPLSGLWKDTPALSPNQLSRSYCLAASLLDSTLR